MWRRMPTRLSMRPCARRLGLWSFPPAGVRTSDRGAQALVTASFQRDGLPSSACSEGQTSSMPWRPPACVSGENRASSARLVKRSCGACCGWGRPLFRPRRFEARPASPSVATPWDWRLSYRLRDLELSAQPGGQPRAGWKAIVEDRHSGLCHEVLGHVEIRWSHGKILRPPRGQGYSTPRTMPSRATSHSSRSPRHRSGRLARSSPWPPRLRHHRTIMGRGYVRSLGRSFM